MEPNAIQNIPAGAMMIIGLVQFALIVWIFIFPVLILKKLNALTDIIKQQKENQ